MKNIWKYELKIEDNQIIKMPSNAEILCVQTQYGKPCLWALVDSENEVEERVIEIFGTGHNIPVDMVTDRKYISTFQMQGGMLVFHVFERLQLR